MIGIDKLRERFEEFKLSMGKEESDDEHEGYIEIHPESDEKGSSKLVVKYYVLTEFDDIKQILEDLRDGYTVAFVRIKPLKDKNINELKRAIDKIKKTCFALEGEVIGLEEEWIVAVPPYVQVKRGNVLGNEQV